MVIKYAVIGAGAIGSALGRQFTRAGIDVAVATSRAPQGRRRYGKALDLTSSRRKYGTRWRQRSSPWPFPSNRYGDSSNRFPTGTAESSSTRPTPSTTATSPRRPGRTRVVGRHRRMGEERARREGIRKHLGQGFGARGGYRRRRTPRHLHLWQRSRGQRRGRLLGSTIRFRANRSGPQRRRRQTAVLRRAANRSQLHLPAHRR